MTLVGSTRADDIVRDADILHLYKKAGMARWLLGIENYDEATLHKIRKGGSTTTDREAIRLLRQHHILSMATWVIGFDEETDRDYLRGLRQLLTYDPDQIQVVYATPTVGPRITAWRLRGGSSRPIGDDGITSIKFSPLATWRHDVFCCGQRSSKSSCNCVHDPYGVSSLILTAPYVMPCAGIIGLDGGYGPMKLKTSSFETDINSRVPPCQNSGVYLKMKKKRPWRAVDCIQLPRQRIK